MFNELNKLFDTSLTTDEPNNVFVDKFSVSSDGGIRDLIEAQFYRETCLAEEKKRSSILNVTLDKLIKAMVTTK